jgi:hypothetical protein
MERGAPLRRGRSRTPRTMRCFAVQILVFQMRVDEHSPDGTEHVQQSYLYNGDGTNTVTLYIDPPLRYKNITVSADVMLHISLDAACIMTIRDRAGRDMKKILCGSDYRVIERVLFRYDAAGRLVEEGEVESGSRLRADMRNLYEYDHQGNRSGRNALGRLEGNADRAAPNGNRSPGDTSMVDVLWLRIRRAGQLDLSNRRNP